VIIPEPTVSHTADPPSLPSKCSFKCMNISRGQGLLR
jgi:hypothetical protein